MSKTPDSGHMASAPEAVDYFVGIDGGGSRCRARLRDADGRLLASVHGGAANVYLDFEGALHTIRTCVAATLRQARLTETAAAGVRIGLGLAGASSRLVAEQIEAAFTGYADVRVVNDAVTACIGAHAGEDGGLVIAGTGSAGVACLHGESSIIGGRGFVLGDDGSGARIGLEAWRRALRAHDGLEEKTEFTAKLMAQFDDDPGAVIRWGLRAKSSDYGAYAPATFSAAGTGDPVALSIVTAAADSLNELALAVDRMGADRLALTGGIADAIRPYLPPDTGRRLAVPMLDALEGAILLVGGRVPFLGTTRSVPVLPPR